MQDQTGADVTVNNETGSIVGYTSPVALDRDRLKNRGIDKKRCDRFASSLNIVPLNLVEFFQAVSSYPVAFFKYGNRLMPCAVLGLLEHQNLFIDNNGQWKEGVYVPAYVRRYPFITESPTVSDLKTDEQDLQKPVYVDESALEENNRPLFIGNGVATAEWERYEKFISEYMASEKQSLDFSDKLNTLNLLKPFDVNVHPRAGDRVQLKGLYRVEEALLNDLPAATVKSLMKHGQLSRIYAHLISLEKFARLLDLSAHNSNTST